ncbi:hypothetical protein HPB47_014690 [Ixodes persulcatus]|uniref:Uncharacterized protein n=1 Tax=Ixodes persulcatus TaxID=34615 RepID=A0AC60QVM3_IXOPE|nr:hypothetical protein HPB47_014690 [Ixodes persulcatus]
MDPSTLPPSKRSKMDDGSDKWKRKTISIEQKAATLEAIESGVKKKKVAEDLGTALSTLSTILSSKQAVTSAVARGIKGDTKKLRAPALEAVEKLLVEEVERRRTLQNPEILGSIPATVRTDLHESHLSAVE